MFLFDLHRVQFDLSATKCSDGHSGLVRVRGWSRAVNNGKAVVFTILDEDDQHGWTRLIDGGSPGSHTEPLEVNIPRSSIGHRITVTAKTLKGRPRGVVRGVEHLEVGFTSCRTATEELAVAGDVKPLAHLLGGMPMSSAESSQLPNNVQVDIEQTTTFSKVKVVITDSSMSTHWQISVKPADRFNRFSSIVEHVFILRKQHRPDFKQEFEFPISFMVGEKYQVDVLGLNIFGQISTFIENSDFKIICGGYAKFKAGLVLTEIKTLYAKAVAYAGRNSHARCVYLYRNNPQPYFDDIFQNHGGLMEVRLKDDSGDPGSPINGRINGLFFMASVERGSTTGQPMTASAFGPTRLTIPAKTLLDKASKLYFADFYCMKGDVHYVTLVMTRPGSGVDVFCSRRLLQLSYERSGNPFLFYDECGQLQVTTEDNLLVEVLFTENLDISQYRYDLRCNMQSIGKGQTTPGGVPKKKDCTICNLSVTGYGRSFVDLLLDEF